MILGEIRERSVGMQDEIHVSVFERVGDKINGIRRVGDGFVRNVKTKSQGVFYKASRLIKEWREDREGFQKVVLDFVNKRKGLGKEGKSEQDGQGEEKKHHLDGNVQPEVQQSSNPDDGRSLDLGISRVSTPKFKLADKGFKKQVNGENGSYDGREVDDLSETSSDSLGSDSFMLLYDKIRKKFSGQKYSIPSQLCPQPDQISKGKEKGSQQPEDEFKEDLNSHERELLFQLIISKSKTQQKRDRRGKVIESWATNLRQVNFANLGKDPSNIFQQAYFHNITTDGLVAKQRSLSESASDNSMDTSSESSRVTFRTLLKQTEINAANQVN